MQTTTTINEKDNAIMPMTTTAPLTISRQRRRLSERQTDPVFAAYNNLTVPAEGRL